MPSPITMSCKIRTLSSRNLADLGHQQAIAGCFCKVRDQANGVESVH